MGDENPIVRIESSNSVWLFDTARMRFLRAARGTEHQTSTLAGEWQQYFGLEVEPTGSFTVALNEDGTRFLRAWVEPPAGERTTELEAVRAPE